MQRKRSSGGEATLTHPTRRSARRSGAPAPLPPPPAPKPGQDGEVEVETVETTERYGDAQYTAADVGASLSAESAAAPAEAPRPVEPAASQSAVHPPGTSSLVISALRAQVAELEASGPGARCAVCRGAFVRPVVSVICWHVCCEQCFLTALGTRGLCPHCTSITMPGDLRRIYF